MTKPNKLFEKTVKEALKHIHAPEWLGNHSPLAKPYFLGKYTPTIVSSHSTERGQQLIQLLKDALADMWQAPLPETRQALMEAVEADRQERGNKSQKYFFLLLELHYFRQYFPSRTYPVRVSDIPDFVAVSPARFYAHDLDALAMLASYIAQRVQPSLRLEQPVLQRPFIGRDILQKQCLEQLQAKQSVMLSGTAGIGKTTLAIAVGQAWSETAVFWYTIRPNLNDQLQTILFAMASFLNQQGITSQVWLQLIADEGQLRPEIDYLGILRQDIEQCSHLPLFCIDEIDLLHTAYGESKGHHIAILEFLQGLAKIAPLLLIGQRPFLDTQHHHILTGLNPNHVETLCQKQGRTLTKEQTLQLHTHTEGNPRLIEMYLSVWQMETKRGATFRLPQKINLHALFHRVWKRLSLPERQVLAYLSVFRTYAPSDIWQTEAQIIADLQALHLISTDKQTNLLVAPTLQAFIHETLLPQQRQELHRLAASVHAERGDFTEAAYHYWQAGDILATIQVWAPHASAEIHRGQVGAALAIFDNITPEQLQGRWRGEFIALRNRLYELEGQYNKIINAPLSLLTPEQQAIVQGQQANAADLLGDVHTANQQYETTLNKLTDLTSQTISTRRRYQYLQMRQGDWASAKREVTLARFEVEKMQGVLYQYMGQFAESTAHLETAVQLAQKANHPESIATAQHVLLENMSMLGDVAQAVHYGQQVMAYYEQVGNRVRLEGARADLGIVYHESGDYQTAVDHYSTALQFFTQVQHRPRIANITVNLAEAYYELGEFAKAFSLASQVRQMEEAPDKTPYALYIIGSIYDQQNKYKDAEQIFTQSIQIAQKFNDNYILARCQRALGCLYMQQNETISQGKPLLQQALEQFEQMGFSETSTDIQLIRQYLP